MSEMETRTYNITEEELGVSEAVMKLGTIPLILKEQYPDLAQETFNCLTTIQSYVNKHIIERNEEKEVVLGTSD